MNQSFFNNLNSPGNLEKVVEDLLKVTATEEKVLAKILSLEHEIIQKAKDVSANLEDFVAINESANKVIKSITKAQMMTQIKLQFVEDWVQNMELLDDDGDLKNN